jgi:elongation factor P hydroxylase
LSNLKTEGFRCFGKEFSVKFTNGLKTTGSAAAQQAEFERVEVKPQATEWILADAAGFRFRVSSDNLNGEVTDNSAFKQAVYEQVGAYIQQGLPERTACLRDALCHFYKTPINLCYSRFDLTTL